MTCRSSSSSRALALDPAATGAGWPCGRACAVGGLLLSLLVAPLRVASVMASFSSSSSLSSSTSGSLISCSGEAGMGGPVPTRCSTTAPLPVAGRLALGTAILGGQGVRGGCSASPARPLDAEDPVGSRGRAAVAVGGAEEPPLPPLLPLGVEMSCERTRARRASVNRSMVVT
eukprot:CAMPEP_0171208132 /NCGR_PEP_ID=MMETSP0790-20130122/27933_1 /TAXON_ID=2925 /ORGANISM="Alexandrium catenella, Strain OF101" /LENGTH=172 /DNA_ID=CAMNT_0011673723 /DNA_START=111 /DNA_END=625 /DNA_ORIENTATION=+